MKAVKTLSGWLEGEHADDVVIRVAVRELLDAYQAIGRESAHLHRAWADLRDSLVIVHRQMSQRGLEVAFQSHSSDDFLWGLMLGEGFAYARAGEFIRLLHDAMGLTEVAHKEAPR